MRIDVPGCITYAAQVAAFINKILSIDVGGNPLPLGGGRSLVNL